ncbi:glycosyltransferase [Subtercola sp. YIM 133946]|uniref:glycosyltransferase n=1 Tax=Subtercola sp. YIM 133946 TaxID=3118909 RepID=UPI002F91EE43
MRAERESVRAVAVVVPARNEEALIGACLCSIERAVQTLGTQASVVTVVVDDDSSDATAAIAGTFHGVTVLGTPGGNVGRARATGVDSALAALDLDPAEVWIASTDADSTVPPHWLAGQLRLAAEGADVVLGTVRPTFAELTAKQVAAWLHLHRRGVAQGEIHGANLGVRGDVYRRSGGFRALDEHEDVELVTRLRELTDRVVSTAEIEVVTSGRLFGRTPGGFAGYLRTQLVPPEIVVR